MRVFRIVDGHVLVPVEYAKQIAHHLRVFEELVYTLPTRQRLKHKLQSLAYCIEQAKEKP